MLLHWWIEPFALGCSKHIATCKSFLRFKFLRMQLAYRNFRYAIYIYIYTHIQHVCRYVCMCISWTCWCKNFIWHSNGETNLLYWTMLAVLGPLARTILWCQPFFLVLCRKATSEMMCMRCLKVQPVGPTCRTPSCAGFWMAKYYCNICKFFDDERLMTQYCISNNILALGKINVPFFLLYFSFMELPYFTYTWC